MQYTSKEPLVSIIVPIYNAQDFLKDCITSILAQTYTEWELILINDGSTDNSEDICKVYSSSDRRIKYLKKTNGGVGSARNLGLRHISGDWVTFVDADDQIYPYFVETLVKLAINADCDSVCAGYVECDSKGNVLYSTENVHDYKFLTYKQSVLDFYQLNVFKYNGYIWNRLFRVSVIKDNNLSFNENIYYKEDGLFVMQFISKSKKNIPFTPYPVYKYYMNTDSATHQLTNKFNKKYVTTVDARILTLKAVEESNISDAYLLHIVRYNVIISYYYITREMRKYNVKDQRIKDTIKQKIKNSVPFHYYCLIYLTPLIPIAKLMLGKNNR